LKIDKKQASVKRTALRMVFVTGLLLLVCSAANQLFAQNRLVQLSGVVLGEDSVSGLPGVHVYVPKAGRGTTTNHVGFFSLAVKVGDSLVISSVGYERQHFIVPQNAPEFQTIIVQLVQDATYLREIVVMDFPTEEVFKQAVLALNVPVDQSQIDPNNLNQELLALMLKTTPMDGYQNQRYALNQWANSATDKYQPISNPLLNPFNWVKFFNSLKKDKKKK
jgi:hypothetical protein